MPTTERRTFAADIAQAMRDWDNATPAQRLDALAKANELAGAAEKRLGGEFGILAIRSAGSVCGAAEAWLKSDGKVQRFETIEAARTEASRIQGQTRSPNVHYVAKPFAEG